jgi:hypothetical protein
MAGLRPATCHNNYQPRFDDLRNSARVAARMAKLPSARLLIFMCRNSWHAYEVHNMRTICGKIERPVLASLAAVALVFSALGTEQALRKRAFRARR